jgi:hypothetical protein
MVNEDNVNLVLNGQQHRIRSDLGSLTDADATDLGRVQLLLGLGRFDDKIALIAPQSGTVTVENNVHGKSLRSFCSSGRGRRCRVKDKGAMAKHCSLIPPPLQFC